MENAKNRTLILKISKTKKNSETFKLFIHELSGFALKPINNLSKVNHLNRSFAFTV